MTDRRACDRAGCGQPARKRGLCLAHYERERARRRDRTDRLIPNRARNRAASLLIAAHRDEFAVLYERALAEVTAEAQRLEELCDAEGAEPTGDRKVWRLRPGPRPDDEDPEDRVTRDAWRPDCRDCAAWHAAGHVCAACAKPPAPPPPAARPGSRADVEARMRCTQCGGDGTTRRQPCVGPTPSGEIVHYVVHAYELARSS